MPSSSAFGQAQIETGPSQELPCEGPVQSQFLALTILWSASEPHRVGQRAECSPGKTLLLGRAPHAGREEEILCFREPRGDFLHAEEKGAESTELLGESLSRRQLEVRCDGDGLILRNVGRCPMWVNGSLTGKVRVGHGDTIHLQQQLLLLCTLRRRQVPSLNRYPEGRVGRFGQPDAEGIVGEGSAVWQLRERLAAVAQCEGHVLILGESGSGKELAARALHNLSPRAQRTFISGNIATIPSSLGAALLFGNRRNYPNPGMDERAGLIGSAEGGTLFLDELGDMAAELQPMLLRVMDRGAEYIRLGDDAHIRRANVRFLAATNHPERLRPELRRRFHHELLVPSLNERPEDIPLLVRHLLLTQLSLGSEGARFCRNGQLRIDPRLLEQLVRHRFSTQVSELAFLIERALRESPGEILLPLSCELHDARPARVGQLEPVSDPTLTTPPAALPQASPPADRELPTPAAAQAMLDSVRGSVVRAAEKLGITRHQLNRLIRRHQLNLNRS